MSKKEHLPEQIIASKIYEIRSEKVMIDSDLAELYGVETRVMNQAVKRNLKRFPDDFMFELTTEEWDSLKSQNVTSSWGGRRTQPKVFTEQGVAMLSSVLNSDTAISVNIQIIRVFTKMREMILDHKDILLKLDKIEQKLTQHDDDLDTVFTYLKKLLNPSNPPRESIGYKRKDEE